MKSNKRKDPTEIRRKPTLYLSKEIRESLARQQDEIFQKTGVFMLDIDLIYHRLKNYDLYMKWLRDSDINV